MVDHRIVVGQARTILSKFLADRLSGDDLTKAEKLIDDLLDAVDPGEGSQMASDRRPRLRAVDGGMGDFALRFPDSAKIRVLR